MLLTPEVVRDIAKIIRDHHSATAAVIFGADAVSAEVWDTAVKLGLVDPSKPESLALLLHLYGAYLADVGGDADSHGDMGLEEFRALFQRAGIPQTDQEELSAQFVHQHGADHIVGLGGKAATRASSAMSEINRSSNHELRQIVRDVVGARFGDEKARERAVAAGAEQGLTDDFFDGIFRETIGRGVSDIGHLSGDWRRDLQRIMQTEAHGAVQQGLQDRWQAAEEESAKAQQRPVEDVLVYKIPRPGACPHCTRLHLDGDVPRIYELSIVQGGTNVGKRAPDWQFVIGSVHPWCGCALFKVPTFVQMPSSWRHGQAAPSVLGPSGRLVAVTR